MNDQNLLNKISVSMIPGAGSIFTRKLIGITGSPEALLAEPKKNLLKIPKLPASVVDQIVSGAFIKRAETELDFVLKHNIDVAFFQDNNFPQRLNECYDAPVLLYHKGNINFNNRKMVSIVGTRRNTKYGINMTEKIVGGLADAGQDVTIVSGLAFGIDILAHKAAVRNNLDSFAVLAHGLDDLYPKVHADTAKEMLKKGGLVSEYTQSTIPDAANFVKRNRVVAGISDVTLVIESGYKGGAMITANLAFSYDREVMAVPGEVGKYYSQGCNWLIKNNKAAVLESADDLIKLMNWDVMANKIPVQKKIFVDLNENEEKIFKLLQDKQKASLNTIGIETELPINTVSMSLLNMELQGIIKSEPGNMFCLT